MAFSEKIDGCEAVEQLRGSEKIRAIDPRNKSLNEKAALTGCL